MAGDIKHILEDFADELKEENHYAPIGYPDYLELLNNAPEALCRDIFQLLHDMVQFYVPKGVNEYPGDPHSINFVDYDFNRLFVKGSDNPFFADRLFGNRFMNLIDSFRHGANRNKIYFFEGPPGSGKSTFLKNLLYRFERYMKTDEGIAYETLWRLEKSRFLISNDIILQGTNVISGDQQANNLVQAILNKEGLQQKNGTYSNINTILNANNYIYVPCPNHDHPILQIPKANRKSILDKVITDSTFKERLFTEKKYKWLFKDEPCTICSSIYEALQDKFNSPLDVLSMIFPRRLRVNRRLGEGVSVYNSGDVLHEHPITNPVLQNILDHLFGYSNKVRYIYSHLAKTNNGIYVIMDVKQNNQKRVINLHGVISDGVHKVENVEETINSVFIGLINPQDKDFIEKTKSLKDRSIYIKIPYVLDYSTEVSIYKNNYSEGINKHFLPKVLENFAKVIVASRMNRESEALKSWISRPAEYDKFCDPHLLLLKMEIYSGKIPDWLQEKDRNTFTASTRKTVIAEGESEGFHGFSGRESIHIFNEFLSRYMKKGKLINMEMVHTYFNKEEFKEKIPEGFLDNLVNSYDYNVLQQVKESLYSKNIRRISSNIQDYIFAVNYDLGTSERNPYTNHMIDINETFYQSLENYLIGPRLSVKERLEFRNGVLRKYISQATREMKVEKKRLTHTGLYRELHERYVRNLKNNALDPFIKNANFRNAIKEYNSKEFAAHDKKIKKDVTFLIKNLQKKYNYTEEGAREVCIYVVDKELSKKFNEH